MAGALVGASAAPIAPPTSVGQAAHGGEPCPDCGTPRAAPGAAFCEVCGYNFRTGASGVPPLAPETAAPAPPPMPAPDTAPANPASAVRWDALVTVDATLYGKPNPAAPVDQPSQTFTLFETESLIGRGGKDIRVHVPILNDVGVSRRQAMLSRRPDGTLVLRDLGSANGTQLNGVELVPGVDTPVKDGDVIAVGAWTKITLRAAPAAPGQE